MLFIVANRKRFVQQILDDPDLTDFQKANAVASFIDGISNVQDAMRWLVRQQIDAPSTRELGLTPKQRDHRKVITLILGRDENPFDSDIRKRYGLAALW